MLRCGMRTTVTLDDQLYSQARIRAAERGSSVGSIIEEALRAYLRQAAAVASIQLPPLPSFDGGGLLPGIDLDDMSSVYEALDEGLSRDELR